jgi:hypothetical protein
MVEEPEYWFSKDKLPGTYSYPLKRSLLDAALKDASVKDAVYSVRYLFSRGKGLPTLLDVLFSPEGRDVHASASGKSLITVFAVPNEKRKSCENILVSIGLPILCKWLTQTSRAGNVWRSKGHNLSLIIQDGVLKHYESE